MNVIEINGLTKAYKKQYAIQKVDLSVEKGEIYGFIGPNGAGKSTTIKIMLNFIYADQGDVRLLGLDSVKKAKEIRQRTGYVSSDVRFYPNATVMQTLKDVVGFHQIANSKQKIDRYIELFEIDPNKKMGELSLGNKKKIAIVAGLIPDPELLILDEPTNGLDPLMQHRLFSELEEKNKEGMTIFLSSHDLNEIQQHAHRAAFIRKGEIVTIEDVSKEMHLGKVITLIGDQIPLELFEKMGAAILKHQGNQTRLFYEGDIQKVLPLLANSAIKDFTITNPELEDQFLALYEGGTNE